MRSPNGAHADEIFSDSFFALLALECFGHVAILSFVSVFLSGFAVVDRIKASFSPQIFKISI